MCPCCITGSWVMRQPGCAQAVSPTGPALHSMHSTATGQRMKTRETSTRHSQILARLPDPVPSSKALHARLLLPPGETRQGKHHTSSGQPG